MEDQASLHDCQNPDKEKDALWKKVVRCIHEIPPICKCGYRGVRTSAHSYLEGWLKHKFACFPAHDEQFLRTGLNAQGRCIIEVDKVHVRFPWFDRKFFHMMFREFGEEALLPHIPKPFSFGNQLAHNAYIQKKISWIHEETEIRTPVELAPATVMLAAAKSLDVNRPSSPDPPVSTGPVDVLEMEFDFSKIVIPEVCESPAVIPSLDFDAPIKPKPFALRYMEKYGYVGGPLKPGGLEEPVKPASAEYGKYHLGIGATRDTVRNVGPIKFVRGDAELCDSKLVPTSVAPAPEKTEISEGFATLPFGIFSFVPPLLDLVPNQYRFVPHSSAPPYSLCPVGVS